MLRSFVFLLLAVPLAFAAPVPKEVRNGAILEGTWKVLALSTNGQPSEPHSAYWTIGAEGTLTRHDEAKPPAAESPIRFKHDRATKAVDYAVNGRNYPGLYELRGDTLKFCFNMNAQDRPRAIGEGQHLNLWTFARVESEEKK